MAIREDVRIDRRKQADEGLEPLSKSFQDLENEVRASPLAPAKKERIIERLRSSRSNLGEILANNDQKKALEKVLDELEQSLTTGKIRNLVSEIRQRVRDASHHHHHEEPRTGFQPQMSTRLSREALEWLETSGFGPPKRPPLNLPPGVLPVPYLLGEGGMGLAVLVHDNKLEIDVVVKIIKTQDGKLIVRVQREAAAMAQAAQLTVAVVRVYHVETDGQPFIKMEYVPGPSETMAEAEKIPEELRKEFQGKTVDGEGIMIAAKHLKEYLGDQFPRRLWIELQEFFFFKAAEALGLLQDQLEIFHRDIKPSNILIMPEVADTLVRWINAAYEDPLRAEQILKRELEGIKKIETPIKICDFGLVRPLSEQGVPNSLGTASGGMNGSAQGEPLTGTGDILGTLGFISTSGILGSGSSDTDHFGLGAAILAMMEGELVLLDKKLFKENPFEYLRWQVSVSETADGEANGVLRSLHQIAPSAEIMREHDGEFSALLERTTRLTKTGRPREEMSALWKDISSWGARRFPSAVSREKTGRARAARQRNGAIGAVALVAILGGAGIFKTVQERNAAARASEIKALQDELLAANTIPHPAERVRALARFLEKIRRGAVSPDIKKDATQCYREAVEQQMVAVLKHTHELLRRLSKADTTELQYAWNVLGHLRRDIMLSDPDFQAAHAPPTEDLRKKIGDELGRRGKAAQGPPR